MASRLLVLGMPGRCFVSLPVSGFYDCLITTTVPRCQDSSSRHCGSSLSITTSYMQAVHCGSLIAFFTPQHFSQIVQIMALIFPLRTHIFFPLCTMKKKRSDEAIIFLLKSGFLCNDCLDTSLFQNVHPHLAWYQKSIQKCI